MERRKPTASSRRARDPPPQKRGRSDASPSVPPPRRRSPSPSSSSSSSDTDRTATPPRASASVAPADEIDLDRPLTMPFPGGPSDPSLIPSFTSHVAAHIWLGSDRDPLKCISHGSKIADWPWWTRESQCTRFAALITASGLRPLIEDTYRSSNKIVVSAFVERWHGETNTFHLPMGEMTITLDDVFCITGMPITGTLVSCAPVQDPVRLLRDVLGVGRGQAEAEVRQFRGQYVRLEWLRRTFSDVSDDWPEERIIHAARAYLLYLLGCTLFTDKSGTRVSVGYLRDVSDLDAVRGIAWGTSALAYLYRQLGLASRVGVKQIAGYLTLLEAWVYEHFTPLSVSTRSRWDVTMPRAQRWSERREYGASLQHLQAMREQIDDLRLDQVNNWSLLSICQF